MELKDYYSILGISQNSTLSEIKSAYRKLSKKFHPDINDGDAFFEEKFKQIQEAYEILSDKERRENYDQIRKYKSSNSSHKFDEIIKQKEEELKRKYEDLIKKREEEFKKKSSDFKKREDSLNQKEKNVNRNRNKIYQNIVAILAVTVILTYFLYSLSDNRKDELPDNLNSIEVIESDNQVVEQKSQTIDSIPELDSDLDFYSIIASDFTGKWKGKAQQYGLNQSWTIEIECDVKTKKIQIAYPSIGCSGELELIKAADNQLKFREKIISGNGNCVDGVMIILKRNNSTEYEYLCYAPGSSSINAQGIISKI